MMLRMNRMMMLSRGGGVGGGRWWCGGWWCWGGGPMPRPRTTLCASLRSRNACEDFARATLYRNLQEKCCSPDWAQNVGTHFVRACTVEMHFNVSQETSEEPLYTKIYRKNAAAPNWAQNADEHFVRACAIEMHFNISQETSGESLYTEICRKNAAAQIEPRTRTHTLCEPEQSKCMSTCRKRHQKSHFKHKFSGKMPRPRLSPECGRTLCASLHSQNACPHFTRDIRRATLHGNLQEKCRGPGWAPWSSTGLYSHRKNPSVWTHCLGKNILACAWETLFVAPRTGPYFLEDGPWGFHELSIGDIGVPQ